MLSCAALAGTGLLLGLASNSGRQAHASAPGVALTRGFCTRSPPGTYCRCARSGCLLFPKAINLFCHFSLLPVVRSQSLLLFGICESFGSMCELVLLP